MSRKQQMIDKLHRNLKQLGLAPVLGNESLVVGGLTLSLFNHSVQAPLAGIDNSIHPYVLGAGIFSPFIWKIKGAAGENSLSAIFDSSAAVHALAYLGAYSNDIVVEAGDTTAELAYIHGSSDLSMIGQ